MFRKKSRLVLLLVAVIVSCWAWVTRTELAGYYHAWRWLCQPGKSGEYHAERLIALAESAWPGLSWYLQRHETVHAENATGYVARWLQTLAANGQLPKMVQRVAAEWPGLNESAQAAFLKALYQCTGSPNHNPPNQSKFEVPANNNGKAATKIRTEGPTSGNSHAASNTSGESAASSLVEVVPSLGTVRGFLLQTQPLGNRLARPTLLRLSHWACVTETAIHHASVHSTTLPGSDVEPNLLPSAEWWNWCRQLAELSLTDEREEVRLEAVRLGALPQVQLKEKLARRLLDQPPEPSPRVRVLLLIALGDRDNEDLVATESLAHWLHDESDEVRKTCEQVLLARGLTPRQVQLARMWTDSDPLVRMQVPKLVYQETEIDPVPWLERLSRDHAEAVRAAVIRIAAEQMELRFAARLAEMSQDDASPTIRQLANYYQREMFARQ